MKFDLTEIRSNVYNFSFEKKYYLSSSFMRIQEFYKSPYENIKGKHFELEEFMDTYAEDKGTFTYFDDWTGFNIPGNIMNEFYKVFKYGLNRKEQIILNCLFVMRRKRTDDNFYVIASSKGKEENKVIKHKLSHAYWYLLENYAEQAQSLIYNPKVLAVKSLNLIKKALKSMGYCEDVFDDEIQTYLGTGSKSDLTNKLKIVDKNLVVSNKFKKLFKQHDESQLKLLYAKSKWGVA